MVLNKRNDRGDGAAVTIDGHGATAAEVCPAQSWSKGMSRGGIRGRGGWLIIKGRLGGGREEAGGGVEGMLGWWAGEKAASVLGLLHEESLSRHGNDLDHLALPEVQMRNEFVWYGYHLATPGNSDPPLKSEFILLQNSCSFLHFLGVLFCEEGLSTLLALICLDVMERKPFHVFVDRKGYPLHLFSAISAMNFCHSFHLFLLIG